MSLTLEFVPWSPFHARKNNAEIQNWLHRVANASEAAFRSGASRQWPGGDAKGSSPGEWPMRRSGNLLGTIKTRVTANTMTISSDGKRSGKNSSFHYSSWLADTGRKMSKEALKEGMQGSHLGRWVEWSRL